MRFVPERPPAADPFQVIARETQLLEEIERLFKPGVEQETAPRRQFAHEKLEYRGLRVSMIQVGLHHVELVEVGEQRGFAGIHSEPLDEWAELYSHVSACSPHAERNAGTLYSSCAPLDFARLRKSFDGQI